MARMGQRRDLAKVGPNVCKICGKRYVVEILARDCEADHDSSR